MATTHEARSPADGLVLHRMLDPVGHASRLLGMPGADDPHPAAGSAMTQLRSSLAAHAGSMREPDPANARRAAREAWHVSGLVLINPEWLTGWVDRQQLINLADKVHGQRPPGAS